MTEQEQRLADDRMRAEIAKMQIEASKIAAEINQIKMNTLLAPALAAAGLMAATAAMVKLFF